MAKYGTKKYWNEELRKEEIQLDLMCNGFTRILTERSSIAIEDVQEMINQLWASSNRISFDKTQIEEAPEDDEE